MLALSMRQQLYQSQSSIPEEGGSPPVSASVFTRSSPVLRPKLFLQTSLLQPPPLSPQNSETALSLGLATNLPHCRNAYSNALGDSSPLSSTSCSAPCSPHAQFSPSSSPVPSASSFAVPYSLPIGTRPILRNSPLPPRHDFSITTARAPRRIFHSIKRVAFSENPLEMLPTPVFDDPAADTDSDSFPREEGDGAASDGDSDGSDEILSPHQLTPVYRRFHKCRGWFWTIGEGGRSSVHIPKPSFLKEGDDEQETSVAQIVVPESTSILIGRGT